MSYSLKATFTKEERLTSKTIIKELFDKGSSFALYPFKILYTTKATAEASSVKVIFTVPKRAFKKAVDRNFIRRRMREAYRLNKQSFYSQLLPQNLSICFIYIAKEKNEYNFVEKKIKLALQKLILELAKNNTTETV